MGQNRAVVTPNADAPYCMLGIDLRTEPMVLTVPEMEPERFGTYLITGPVHGKRATPIDVDQSRAGVHARTRGSSWSWVVFANFLLGINQGLAWSITQIMKLDLSGPRRRGLVMGLNECAGYLSVALAALGAGSAVLARAYLPAPTPAPLLREPNLPEVLERAPTAPARSNARAVPPA